MDSWASRAERTRASSRLTKLYSETKHSFQTALPRQTESASPEKRSFDRKFSIQKDRLIAWGFDWTDNINNGDIDESVERAGLTEVVESVMENIKSIIEDVERMNSSTFMPPTNYHPEKLSPGPSQPRSWMPDELAKYEDLIKDMTTAIDLLCDLSKSRRTSQEEALSKSEEASGKSGKKRPLSYQQPFERPSTPVPAYPTEAPQGVISDIDVANPLHRVESGPYSIPMISSASLILPQEGPPTYGDSRSVMRGAASSPRLFGHVRQVSSNDKPGQGPLLPVMIEYANFDRLYRVTGMELPRSSRLEQLHSILRTWDSSASSALARPIAYFEDPEHARYGLVFNRPFAKPAQQQQPHPSQPTTLSALLHQASRLPSQAAGAAVPLVPALEDRFRLAQQLISAFRFLQQHDFAHRNVSSSNIAVLPKGSNGRQDLFDIRKPLICSIDLFSDYDVEPSPENLQQNIYRHPDDPRIRGPTASPEYHIRYDLYSLSLVLLEIGMWHPLADLYKEKYSLKDFKTRVEKVWIRRLTGRCGSAFTRCVQELFEAGSKSNSSIDLMQILNRVAARLDRCCAIDLDEEETSETEQVPDLLSPVQATDASLEDPRSQDELGGVVVTGKRTLFQDLELPKEILAQYVAFEGQVVRITEKILNRTKESCWIDLLYSGQDKATARPTICVGCSSTKLVRAALKKYLQYDHNVFDLAVFKDTVRRSKSPDNYNSKGCIATLNPDHYQRPLSGSSVGAWRFGEHTAAVSLGGVVLIDNEPYGMTVHHLLEHPDPPRHSQENKAPTKRSLAGRSEAQITEPDLSEDDDDDDEDEDSDGESTLNDPHELELEESDDEDADDFTDGVRMGSTEEIVLTQPALDDVPEGFFPFKEDEDDEHLLSHRLGYVYASSGLRRIELEDGIKHEIDWLLMKIDPGRLQPYNVIAGGKSLCVHEDSLFRFHPKLLDPVCRPSSIPGAAEDLYPCQIAPSCQLPGLPVQCFGRTSGLGTGILSKQMRWVRFHGRSTFSQVWYVTSAGFGQGGDSGAWVVDSEQGRVCGHVLAWSDKFGVAYVAPMDVMIEDMRRTLGATQISLPGADEQPKPVGGIGSLDLSCLSLDELSRSNLLAKHMLQSGNPAHLEREWASRRAKLGQTAS